MTDALKRLSDEGVAIWLDDLSRKRITSGNLAELIDQQHVVGVTTNPTIFQKAISQGDGYDGQLTDLAAREVTVDEAHPHDHHRGRPRRGRHPAPGLRRHATARTAGSPSRSTRAWPTTPTATVAEAKQLAWLVDRPNTLIKIPATKAGLPAITEVIGRGISVNVTLIFSLERYREVMDAYLAGLEKAKAAGLDLSEIHSVASFFVSRVDTEIDKRLEKIGTDEAKALKGKAAVANARLAYQAYEEVFASERWAALEQGAAPTSSVRCGPRPASRTRPTTTPCTSTELVAPNTVNTMPEATLDADGRPRPGHRRHGRAARYAQAQADLDALAGARRVVRRRGAGPGGRGRREVRGGLERAAGLHQGGAPAARPLGGAEVTS